MDTNSNQQHDCQHRAYVLMTAAHNEEAYIEKTILSILSQTVLPKRWVIVSDNSIDRTDEIIESYARQYDFIRFLRITRPPGRSFGSKVLALHRGSKLFEGLSFEFIGNLDADVSVEPFYYKELVNHFGHRPRLGLLSGFVFEEVGGKFRSRSVNSTQDVPHAAQLVRRECYEDIGGYKVLKYGGEDWYAQTSAKMNGWEIEAIPELKIFHHRHTGAGANLLRSKFRLGKLDYSFGSDPAFELIKCLRRILEKPYVVGALARFFGFACGYLHRESRAVPLELSAFLKRGQKERISSLLSHVLVLRSIVSRKRAGQRHPGTAPKIY